MDFWRSLSLMTPSGRCPAARLAFTTSQSGPYLDRILIPQLTPTRCERALLADPSPGQRSDIRCIAGAGCESQPLVS
jgi:hypothetical protein